MRAERKSIITAYLDLIWALSNMYVGEKSLEETGSVGFSPYKDCGPPLKVISPDF